VDCGSHYAILPAGKDLQAYCQSVGGTLVPPGFHYNSGENDQFLTVQELRRLIQAHVDCGFKVPVGAA
jgi:hypothetical protein